MKLTLMLCAVPGMLAMQAAADELVEGTDLSVTMSWNQAPGGWTYDVAILMPADPEPAGGYPVCILLHGNGGTGEPMLGAMGDLIECHVLVAPTGYANSWNLCGEASDAPDVEMVGELVEHIQTFDNIDADRIRIVGVSNGSALANRVLIQNDNPGLDRVVGVVSQLCEPQFHEGGFRGTWGETDENADFCGYDTPFVPVTGRSCLSICNENDPIIPYHGGESAVGVTFLPAQLAAFLIAQSQGYTGEPITGPGEEIGDSGVFEYVYLDGQVVHLRGYEGHGVNETQEAAIAEFLGGCTSDAPCDGDIDGNGVVDVDDVLTVIAGYGIDYDVNDLLGVLASFGAEC